MAGSRALGAALALLIAAGPARASIRQFSYDPADAATRTAAGALTFLIDQGLFSTRVLKLRATEAQATADLRRAGARAAGLPAGDIYEVLPTDDGPSLIAAFCPGSKRAWMAFGPVKLNQDLQVLVFGDDPGGGPARHCQTLSFTFHGEWRPPPGSPPAPRVVGMPKFPN